ncbi:MAG: DUF411 domain-containing protein [Cyanobacteria bacterium J06648_16]
MLSIAQSWFSRRRLRSLSLLAFSVLSILVVGCSQPDRATLPNAADLIAAAGEVTVFRSPTCGCCGQWAEHLQAAGFQIKDELTEDMDAVKAQYNIPDGFSACHTAIVGDYVVEGHIPVEDVIRLLAEKPDIAGIAVPGMPIGSPGMESGNYVEPYTVFSYTETGETAAFSAHS